MATVITVLHLPGCAGGRAAVDIAERVAASRGDLVVEDLVVSADMDVAALGFRGSPTVLVDGLDVEDDPQAPLGSMG